MPDLSWKDAIIKVLETTDESLHYADIAEFVTTRELRKEVGATPANTVGAVISTSIKDDGDKSPFVRVGKGHYRLREKSDGIGGSAPPAPASDSAPDVPDDAGLINAFGMYWRRDKVFWKTTPRIYGQQQSGSKPVDFCNQKGVYLLHDGRSVVYVGRTTDQTLGVRLRQHIFDRLNSRWGRFSWFGIHKVKEDGELAGIVEGDFNIETLIATMEALLIEGLEPPQNRKRGDDFRAVEFLQVEDEEIRKSRILQLMDELKAKL